MFAFTAALRLRADEVDMQNGDRYFGKVLTVSTDTVVLQSDMLGVINVPRNKVSSLVFAANAAPPKAATNVAQISTPTNPPVTGLSASSSDTNVDLSAALRNLGANTNFIGQVRQQFLSGSPGAESNYDEMVNGLLDGSMNMDDLRRQAQAAADQLREMKRQAGPQADPSIDAYLEVLDNFLNETGGGPTNAVSASQPKPQVP